MVVRGAQCNTDHMILRVKVKIGKKPSSRQWEKKMGGLMWHGLVMRVGA